MNYAAGFEKQLLHLKNFQIDLFFQYTKQMGVNPFILSAPPGISYLIIILPKLLGRWQQPGDKSTIQKFTQRIILHRPLSDLVISSFSDFAYTDASFIRLKNVSVSYYLPADND